MTNLITAPIWRAGNTARRGLRSSILRPMGTGSQTHAGTCAAKTGASDAATDTKKQEKGAKKMNAKIIEIRDRWTYIPVLVIKMKSDDEAERYHLRRTGYGEDFPLIAMIPLNNMGRATHDPFDWGDRTCHEAHCYIQDHYDELETGAVVDVEFILGEKPEPKKSARLE